MFKKLSLLALLVGAIVPAGTASARDLGDTWSKERFQIRGRIIDVLADGDGVVTGTNLQTDVEFAVVPEVDLTYFFTRNIAAELIAATSKHDMDAGTLDVGSAWILPPTVTLQYHFTPDSAFSPYIGAGLNYSMFYGEDADAGFNNLDVDGGFGWAVQAGFDYWLNDNWGLNVDAKYIDLDVDVDVNMGSTPLTAKDVELDPWILGAGVSYRF